MGDETSTKEPARERRNVLELLDNRKPTSFYYYLAVLATIGGFLFGYDTSNIGSALDFIPYDMSSFVTGYLVAGTSLGAAIGAILAGPATDKFGRKSLLIFDAVVYAVGAILSAVTVDIAMLLVSRTLIGLAVGADSAIATAYIAEIAPRSKRGSLSILQQWMITIGILVAYLVAILVLGVAPGQASGADWRIMLGVGAIPAIAALLLRARMPESPRWLMHHGRYRDTRQALAKLGLEVTEDEVRGTAEEIEASGRAERYRSHGHWTAGVKRALFVVCVFFLFQQITGINVTFYYGPKIMSNILQGGSSGSVASEIAGVQVTAIMGAVNVVATYFAFRWIDRIGRRKLALGGYLGMMLFMLASAGGIAWAVGLPKTIIVMIGLDLFIASFAIGVGGTGWLLQGEVFPTAIRGRAAAAAAVVDWVANFLIAEFFPAWKNAIGLGWVMVCFAFLSLLALAYVFRYLPETKGRSADEVIDLFEPDAERGGPAIQPPTRAGP
jgi:sugar porter (SP) family MFS transporter